MKTRKASSQFRNGVFLILIHSAIASSARAGSGTWASTASSGNWTDDANWAGSTIATDSGFTASFTSDISGPTTISLNGTDRTIGSIIFSDNGAAGSGWIVTGNTLTLSGGGAAITTITDAIINSNIQGGNGLTKDGAGTLALAGSNNLSGGITINEGTLQLGSGTFGGGNYAISSPAKLYLNYNTASAPAWTHISGSGTIELNSAQPVNGSANWGPNTSTAHPFDSNFTGTLQIDKGRMDATPAGLGGISRLAIGNGAQFMAWSGTYSVPVTIAGNSWGEIPHLGALRLAAVSNATWAGAITLSANAGIYSQGDSNFTLTGSITGPYECEFIRNGNIYVAPAAAFRNSYGSTKISSSGGTYGMVYAGNAYAFSTGALVMNGGALALNGFDATFANLSGNGLIGNFHPLNSAVLTVGADDSDTTYSGWMGDGSALGKLALTKTGTGTLTLVYGGDYTGQTRVNQGTLVLEGTLATGSAVNVASGATLGGTGTVNGPVTAAGTISPGDTSVGRLTTGNTILTGTLVCRIDGATADSLATGTLDISGATLSVTELTPASGGSYTIATYTGTLAGTFASVPAAYTVDYSAPGIIKLAPKGAGYTGWAASHGISGESFDQDHDGDGITNGLEYALGTDPATFTAPQALVQSGSGFTLTYTKGSEAAADPKISYQFETSPDLQTWTPVEATAEDSTMISYTLATDSPAKFVRLKVTQAP